MSKSFLDLLEALKSSETDEQKSLLSQQLSAALEEDERHSERVFKSYFARTLGRDVGNGFQSIIDSEYFVSRVKVYVDDDYTCKIALGIAFIQDYRASVESLDSEVLESLKREIAGKNLDLLVNDITVNNLQHRV